MLTNSVPKLLQEATIGARLPIKISAAGMKANMIVETRRFVMKLYLAIIYLTIMLDTKLYAAEICDLQCANDAMPYALASSAIYGNNNTNNFNLIKIEDFGAGCSFWQNITPFKSCILSGFKSGLYSNDSGYAILAFQGTEKISVADWETNYKAATGILPKQYQQANDLTSYYKKIYGDKLILTGHSLGGGLAVYAALKNNLKAYAFNPAPIDAGLINEPKSEKIKIYRLRNSKVSEILTYLDWANLLSTKYDIDFRTPSEYGTLITVQAFDIPGDPVKVSSFDPINLHQMVNMVTALSMINDDNKEYGYKYKLEYRTSQFPATTTPAGTTFYQYATGFTPNGKGIFYIKHEDSSQVDSFDFSFDSSGDKEFIYQPPANKPYGTYLWWVKDISTGYSTENDPVFYTIIQPNNPAYVLGYEGGETIDNTPPAPECLPDFVSKRAWITKSENGADKYVFEPGDKAWINVKVKNEGCANSPQDIDVWYLLSKGEKEDNHHDWVKVGTDTIRDYELAVGQDKWEKEEFTVPTEPGKYNIVVCADRVALYDNGDGAVREEHKSNDCSTEAVFTVLPKNNAPVGYFDSADCSSFSGWAKDPDTSSSVFIRFYKDGTVDTGTYIGSTFADNYRGDLPYTDKEHGFSFTLPDSLNDGAPHQIYAYAIDDAGGTNPLLTNSPKTVRCGLAPDQAAAVMSVINEILMEDVDSDGDSILDSKDNCPSVSNADQKNTDGDSSGDACDSDDDNDGVPDISDAFPLNPNEWADTDGDGIGNNADPDDDNDGVADEQDAFPLDPSESKDADGDSIGDNADPDDDNDGIPDALENQGNTFLPAIKFLLR